MTYSLNGKYANLSSQNGFPEALKLSLREERGVCGFRYYCVMVMDVCVTFNHDFKRGYYITCIIYGRSVWPFFIPILPSPQ